MTKEDAIKELKALKADYWDDDGYGRETIQYYDTMLALNMAIEALEQKPKTGHWILIDKEKNKWRCTHCIELGKNDWWKLNEGTPQDNHMDFCPHCGAKMQEAESEK